MPPELPAAQESPAPNLRLLIVDDHHVVHFGFRLMLARLLPVERCIAAGNGADAVELCRRYEPHVALVDLFVHEESGVDIAARLLEEAIPPKVLLMSGVGNISATAARTAGALGFITKDLSATEIARAIEAVRLGEPYFPQHEPSAVVTLSAREREVLQHLATGATNPEIGAVMHLSKYTILDYTRALFKKLGARNRTEAVQRAQRLGLLE